MEVFSFISLLINDNCYGSFNFLLHRRFSHLRIMDRFIASGFCLAVVLLLCGVTAGAMLNKSVSVDTYIFLSHLKENGCAFEGLNLVCTELNEKSASKIFVGKELRTDMLWVSLSCVLITYILSGKVKVFLEIAAHGISDFSHELVTLFELKSTDFSVPIVKNVTLPSFEEGVKALKEVSTTLVSAEKKVAEIIPKLNEAVDAFVVGSTAVTEVIPMLKTASDALVEGSTSLGEAVTLTRQVVSSKFHYNVVTGKGKVTMPDIE